jgi:hypothetical protein
VFWRWRRNRARSESARPKRADRVSAPVQPATGQSTTREGGSREGAPADTGQYYANPAQDYPRQARQQSGRVRQEASYARQGTDAARPMDRPRHPPVAWEPQTDLAWQDARTDVYSMSAPRPANGRLGSQMPSVFCTGCGEANPENARYCWQCGTALIRSGGDRATAGETTSMIFTGVEGSDGDFGEEQAADAAAVDTLPPNTALLVVRRGPNAGSRFLLDSELTEVGRRPDSDIFLDDVTVSRRHAEFYRHGSTFAVRDVGSLNGTYVNRERIEEAALTGGDEVQIGKFRLVFLQGRLSHAETGG